MKFAVALVAAAVASACSQSPSVMRGLANDGIVNGREATAADVTSFAEPVVGIYTGNAICSGTLIDPQIVLTAGHCFEGVKDPSKVIVFLHVLNMLAKPLPLNGKMMKADNYYVQPNYPSDSSLDDVALIHLSEPVPAGTKLAQLPTLPYDYSTLTEVMALGYGVANDAHNASFEETGAGTLRYTTFAVEDLGFIPATEQYPKDLRGMLAAHAVKTAVCSGDSGGPLMLSVKGASQNVIIGINDAVIPAYEGEQGEDFQKAAATGDLAGFYKKYPTAASCTGGLNFFVPVTERLEFITMAKDALLKGTAPKPRYIPDPSEVVIPEVTPVPAKPAN